MVGWTMARAHLSMHTPFFVEVHPVGSYILAVQTGKSNGPGVLARYRLWVRIGHHDHAAASDLYQSAAEGS